MLPFVGQRLRFALQPLPQRDQVGAQAGQPPANPFRSAFGIRRLPALQLACQLPRLGLFQQVPPVRFALYLVICRP